MEYDMGCMVTRRQGRRESGQSIPELSTMDGATIPMRIIVKPAHYIKQTCFIREIIRDELFGIGGVSKCRVAPQAYNAVCKNWGEDLVNENVFDDIYPLCNEEEERLLKTSLIVARTRKEFRPEVALDVEPSMTIGSLKLLLKAQPWIPKKNLMLVKECARLLRDDNTALQDCGIKEEESVLLACMGGCYPLTICDLDLDPFEEFVIPVRSCFETISYLKKKIHQKRGKTPDDQKLFYQSSFFSRNDSISLVACGIVRPYLPDICNMIEMFTESNFQERYSKYDVL